MITNAHTSYQHEAYLYRGADEFLVGTVGFVRDAVALGQPVMVAVPEPRLTALTRALGADASRVRLVDMGDMGHNPARIIPAWQAFVAAEGRSGRPLRGIGEPIWSGRRDAELVECQLHEALLNIAVEPDVPFWLRCPYDVDGLAPEAVQQAQHSHPAVVEDGSLRGSTRYGGVAHVEEVFARDLPEPRVAPAVLTFSREDLVHVRRAVAHDAHRAGLGANRTADLVLAVTELATNSLRHGGGRGVLRTWREDGAMVSEVRDDGLIGDLLVGRRRPGPDDEGGRGVWMANQLCDLVQVRSSSSGGTVVRTHVWL
jgi:anti-sigma regulatory factor (Ser/Thr protein kinase)